MRPSVRGPKGSATSPTSNPTARYASARQSCSVASSPGAATSRDASIYSKRCKHLSTTRSISAEPFAQQHDQAARETDDIGEVSRMLAIRTGNRKRDLEANARLETGTRDQARGRTRVAMKNEPVQGSMDDPTWVALQRCPWCLVVPTGYPDDPDIIGPFTSFEEAKIWSRAYPEAFVRTIASPEFVILCRADEEEDKARRRPRN